MKEYKESDLIIVAYTNVWNDNKQFIVYTDKVVPDESDCVDEYNTRVYPDVINDREKAIQRALDILNGKLKGYRYSPWIIKNKPSKIYLTYRFGT